MKILLFRSNNYFDSRVLKYLNFYKRNSINYKIIGWDRNCENLLRERYDFFVKKADSGKGGIKAIKNHTLWMSFVFSYLKHESNVTTVHACDLNSAFPVAVYKCFFNKQLNLIFDVCDWFSDNFANHRLLKHIFHLMEKFTCKMSNEIIICEAERRCQITFPLKKEPLIMPNIPEVDSPEFTLSEKYSFNNNLFTIAYFGGFAHGRLLSELFSLAEEAKVNLLIGGYGNPELQGKCNQISKLPNVKYFGKMSMMEGLEMSYNADLIFASYSISNPNHIYAAPNKYYEAMLLGKPLITNNGTILAEKVLKNNVGYVFDENLKSLRSLIDTLRVEDLKTKSKNSRKLWESHYSKYLNDFFKETYSKIIK